MGLVYNASAAGRLDDLAQVHHRDPVAHMPDDTEIVRDEQVGQAELVLNVLEQVDDLRLHGHVEGRHRLVGDDQLGPQRKCPGDPDTLALPAGELVRIAVVVLGLQARPDPAVPAPAASARRPLASPCSSIGSPMIWPTRLRGFSEANGSWKTIWICRRIGRRCPRERPTSSCPANRTDPDVGVVSCRIARQRVDFPQPDSPTRPSVSPSCSARLTPSTARTRATSRSTGCSRLDREVLDKVGHLEQRFAPVMAPPASAGRSGRPPHAARACPTGSSQQRSRWPSPRAPSSRRRLGALARTRAGSAARSGSRTAGRSSDGG